MADIAKMDIERLELLHDVIHDELYNHQGREGDSDGREDIRNGLKMLKAQVKNRIFAKTGIVREAK